jgi:capsular exopolysaccharide synthesis family protein
MEKIKRAIEESKRKQQNNKHKDSYSDPVLPLKSVMQHDEQEINYEFTRVVSLNPEHLTKNRIVAFNKNDQLSISFDILRTQVIKKMMENGWRTIGITSPTPGCGKTVLSINLAMSIAQHENRTALLVDFDLRRPSVAKYLGLPSGQSLNEVLTGEDTMEHALINPGVERFVVLPTFTPVKKSSEILSSGKVANLITELRERYKERIVIFDLPPMLGSDDAMIMMPQVDCVLLVVGNGMVGKEELKECMRYVDTDKLLGTVLNKVEQPQVKRLYYDY